MRKYQPHKAGFASHILRLALMCVLVVGFMLPARPAHAQLVVNDIFGNALAAAKWAMNQLQLAGMGEGNTVGQAIQSAMATMRADNAIEAGNRNVRMQVAMNQSINRIMGPNQTFCPAIMRPRVAMDVANARRSLSQAMMSVQRRVATNDINSRVAFAGMLCKAGILPQDSGSKLFNCTTPPDGDTAAAVDPKTVFSSPHYPWPSTLTVGSNGTVTFSGNPTPADMPAVRAIGYCLLKHATTDNPIDGTRKGNSNDADLGIRIAQEYASTTPQVSSCVDAVVNRLVIGPNAPGNLGTIYTAYAQQCQLLFHEHKMSQTDEQNCLNNGISYYDLKQAAACGRADDYFDYNTVQVGADIPTMKRTMDEENNNCDSLHAGWDAEEQALVNASAGYAPPLNGNGSTTQSR